MIDLTRKIYICGVSGSGKSALTVLLDGHPAIAWFPHQGIGTSLLTTRFRESMRRDRLHGDAESIKLAAAFVCILDGKEVRISVSDFITFLFSKDRLVRLMQHALVRSIQFPSAETGGGGGTATDFDFDFFIFLKDLTNRLIEGKYFPSVEHLQEVVYQCIYQNWRNFQDNGSRVENFMLGAHNGPEAMKEIIKTNKEYKIIVVSRDPVSISYTNAERIFAKKNPDGENVVKQKTRLFGTYNSYENTLYSQTFMRKIKSFESYVYEISKKNTNVFVVSFTDLLFKTEETMDKVLEFLNLQSNPVVYKPTLNSQRLESDSVRFVGVMNDDAEKALSEKQIAMFRYFYTDQYSSLMGFAKNPCMIIVGALKWKLIWLIIGLKKLFAF